MKGITLDQLRSWLIVSSQTSAPVVVIFVDGAYYLQRFLQPQLLAAGNVRILKRHSAPDIIVYSLFGHTASSRQGTKLLLCGEPNDVSGTPCQYVIDAKDTPDRRPRHAKFLYLPFYAWSFGERYQNVPEHLVEKPAANVIAYEKFEFCAFMYGQDVGFRNRLYDAVSQYKQVDALGKCKGGPGKDRYHYKPGRSTYLDLAVSEYKPYKFVICCGNSRYPGYITDKIINAMRALSRFITALRMYCNISIQKASFMLLTMARLRRRWKR